jgi:hypothetical protein
MKTRWPLVCAESWRHVEPYALRTMAQTLFVWNGFDPVLARCAVAQRGAIVVCADCGPNPAVFKEIAQRGDLHHLDEATLIECPPRGVEGYSTSSLRFAIGASEVARKLAARGGLQVRAGYAGAPAYGILQDRRTGLLPPSVTCYLHLSTPASVRERLDGVMWWDLERGITDHLERECLMLADGCESHFPGLARRMLRVQGAGGERTISQLNMEGAAGGTGGSGERVVVVDAFAPRRNISFWLRSLTVTNDINITIELRGKDHRDGSGQSVAERVRKMIPPALRERILCYVDEGQSGIGGAHDVLVAGDIAADGELLAGLLMGGKRVHLARSAEAEEVLSIAGPRAVVLHQGARDEDGGAGEKLTRSILLCRDEPSREVTVTDDPGRPSTSYVVAKGIGDTLATEKPPTIDVVIPYYNLGEYLPATLASLDAQTDRDFHTFIVNDGSPRTQGVPDAALEAARARAKTTVIDKPNGGLSSARNAGLRASGASHVLVLDADDLLDPTYVMMVRRAAALNPRAAVVGTYMRCFTDDPQEITGAWVPTGFDRNLLLTFNGACPASCLLRREAVLPRGYDERLTAFEDWDLWCALATAGHEAVIIPEYLFYYRQRPGSMYHSLSKDQEASLRMQLAAAHPLLPTDISKVLRLEIALRHHETVGLPKPRRYELVDRLHRAAVQTGIARLWR